MNDVSNAYSSGSDHALSEALRGLQEQLISRVQTLGPAAVALELSREQSLTPILNKIEREARVEPRKSVVFLAGFIRAYLDYLEVVVERQEVESADAQLSAGRNERDQVDSVILRTTFAHAGVRATELVSLVARVANVSESSVKFHLKKLAGMRLVEQLKLSRKVVSYRITPLGESVVARRSNPYELALFFIDEAAFDEKLRAAIMQEIESTWPDQQNEEGRAEIRKKQEDRASASIYLVPDMSKGPISSSPNAILNAGVLQYRKKQASSR